MHELQLVLCVLPLPGRKHCMHVWRHEDRHSLPASKCPRKLPGGKGSSPELQGTPAASSAALKMSAAALALVTACEAAPLPLPRVRFLLRPSGCTGVATPGVPALLEARLRSGCASNPAGRGAAASCARAASLHASQGSLEYTLSSTCSPDAKCQP